MFVKLTQHVRATIKTTTRVCTTVRTAYSDQNPTNHHGGRHAAQDFYPVSLISLQASQKVHVFIGTPVPHATRPHRICVPTLAPSLVVPCCVIVAVSGWCREGVGLSVRRLINTTTIDSHIPRRAKVLFFSFFLAGGSIF